MIRTIMKAALASAALLTLTTAALTTSAGADVARAQVVTYHYDAITYFVTGSSAGYPQSADVTVNPCDGTFSGPGVQPSLNVPTFTQGFLHGPLGNLAHYTVSYTVGAQTDYTVTADVTLNPDNSFSGTWSDNYVGGAQSGTVTSVAPSSSQSTNFKNHGDYVKSAGGGADAAHSCIGMPVTSNK
ncbi:MAG TPA: hypothetical protein VGJ03_08230 [Acidimicrobiales bacterium]